MGLSARARGAARRAVFAAGVLTLLRAGALGCSSSRPAPRAPEGDPTPATEPAEPSEETASSEARQVRYHVAPEGLRIEVDGLALEPRATAVRVGGGWGVRVEVLATSRDGREHVLRNPEQGPLALFTQLARGSDVEERSDQRRGDGELVVSPAEPVRFSRDWPPPGQAPARPGQKLSLEVGLWGLGSGGRAAPLRLLPKLCVIHMTVGSKQPRPLVSPPDLPAP